MSEIEFPAGIDGAVELVGRALFRFTGSDRLRYLNGQVTNDVAKASREEAIYACVTNAKGKLEGDVFVRAFGEGAYLVDGPAELREDLGLRLDRYIIADDVEMEDVSEAYSLFHVLGDPGGADLAGLEGVDWEGASLRFGVPGCDLLAESGEANRIRGELAGGVGFLPREKLEEIRVFFGIPVWGSELGSDLLPPEARLEARAIDYEKGCYIGQEVISRIRSVGRVNRLLCGLVARSGTFEAGDRLFSKDEDGGVTEVGRVTSAVDSTAGRIGLGFVKRASSNPGIRLSCGKGENSLSSEVEIREIPLPL